MGEYKSDLRCILDGRRNRDLVSGGRGRNNSGTELLDSSINSRLGVCRRRNVRRKFAVREPLRVRGGDLLHAGRQTRIVTLKDKGELKRCRGRSSSNFRPGSRDMLGSIVGARGSIRARSKQESKGEKRGGGKRSHGRGAASQQVDSWSSVNARAE